MRAYMWPHRRNIEACTSWNLTLLMCCSRIDPYNITIPVHCRASNGLQVMQSPQVTAEYVLHTPFGMYIVIKFQHNTIAGFRAFLSGPVSLGLFNLASWPITGRPVFLWATGFILLVGLVWFSFLQTVASQTAPGESALIQLYKQVEL